MLVKSTSRSKLCANEINSDLQMVLTLAFMVIDLSPMKLADVLRKALDAHKPHGVAGGYDGKRPAGKAPGHPLDRMLARNTISQDEYLACCRFRAEYEAAVSFSSGATVNWDQLDLYAVQDDEATGRIRSSKQPKMPKQDIGHYVDVRGHIDAVYQSVGPLSFQFLRGVAVLGLPLKEIARVLGIHRDIAGFRFREAVETLVDHYEDQS